MKYQFPLRRRARIEMLPLIDVVFLVLVVFIYTMLSMAVHKGLPVELPSSAATEVERQITLAVTLQKQADGRVLLFVNKEQVELAELTAVLRMRAETARQDGRPEPGVLFFADDSIDYQSLFQVLDRIRLAGLGKISLQAEEAGGR